MTSGKRRFSLVTSETALGSSTFCGMCNANSATFPPKPPAGIADCARACPFEDVLETRRFYHLLPHHAVGPSPDLSEQHRHREICTATAKCNEALELEAGTRFGGSGSADFGLF